jgi:hypothetical protein
MRVRTRKVVAGGIGILFALAGIAIGFVGQFFIAALADWLVQRPTDGDIIHTLPATDSGFYVYLVVAMSISAGLAVTIMLWERRPNFATRFSAYLALLVCYLPVSVYNYAHADVLVNRTAQAILNLYLVFAGSLVVMHLFSLRPAAKDLVVLQAIAIFTYSFTSVLLPAGLTAIWFANQVNLISLDQARAIGLPALSAVTGIVSAAMTYYKLRKEWSETIEKRPSSGIILPP